MDWAESDYKRGLVDVEQYGYLLRADSELEGVCDHADIVIDERIHGTVEEICKGCGIVLRIGRIDEERIG